MFSRWLRASCWGTCKNPGPCSCYVFMTMIGLRVLKNIDALLGLNILFQVCILVALVTEKRKACTDL